MNKKIIYLVILVGLFAFTGLALAQGGIQINNPLQGVNSIGDLLQKIITAVGALIGALGVIMLIVAGLLFATSAGSPNRVTSAKNAFTYAIIGIIIGLAAGMIVATIKYVAGA